MLLAAKEVASPLDAPLTPSARPVVNAEEHAETTATTTTPHHLPSPLHMRTPVRAALRSTFTTPHHKDSSSIAHPDFELYDAKAKLEHELRARKERLRKLQLVKTYRTVGSWTLNCITVLHLAHRKTTFRVCRC